MKTKVNQILIAAVALAVFALIPAAIKADPIFIAGQGTVTIAQGGSSGFNASATNAGPPRVFLNALSITFSGPASKPSIGCSASWGCSWCWRQRFLACD